MIYSFWIHLKSLFENVMTALIAKPKEHNALDLTKTPQRDHKNVLLFFLS